MIKVEAGNVSKTLKNSEMDQVLPFYPFLHGLSCYIKHSLNEGPWFCRAGLACWIHKHSWLRAPLWFISGKLYSRSIPLEWEDTYGIALISGVKYKKGSLVINDTGLYFVYSKVYFRGQSCDNQPLSHKVYMRNSRYHQDLVLMEGKMMSYCTTGQMWARSSYLGAVFNLTSADRLYVNVSELSLVNFEESKTFFGLYKL